jgi:hypothetical protein
MLTPYGKGKEVWVVIAKAGREEVSLASTSWASDDLSFTFQRPGYTSREVSIPNIKATARQITDKLSPSLDCLFPSGFPKVSDDKLTQLKDLTDEPCFWVQPSNPDLSWLTEKSQAYLSAALSPNETNLKLVNRNGVLRQNMAKDFLSKCQEFLQLFLAQFVLTAPISPRANTIRLFKYVQTGTGFDQTRNLRRFREDLVFAFAKEKAEGLSGFRHGSLHIISSTAASHLLHFLIFVRPLEIYLLENLWPSKYSAIIPLFKYRIFVDRTGTWSSERVRKAFQQHTADLYGPNFGIRDQRQTQTSIFRKHFPYLVESSPDPSTSTSPFDTNAGHMGWISAQNYGLGASINLAGWSPSETTRLILVGHVWHSSLSLCEPDANWPTQILQSIVHLRFQTNQTVFRLAQCLVPKFYQLDTVASDVSELRRTVSAILSDQPFILTQAVSLFHNPVCWL